MAELVADVFRPQRGHVTIAQRFNAGADEKSELISPVGTIEIQPSLRDYDVASLQVTQR
jgi:hypothetical protein